MYILKPLADPIVILLLLIGTGLCLSREFRKECSKRAGWWILLISFAILYLLSIQPVVLSLAYLLERDYLSHNISKNSEIDIVVVLGGGILKRGLQPEYDPSGETLSRLLFGLQMLRQSGAEFIVLSGRGSKDVSEAEVMASIAKRLGVNESKIIIEANSDNTKEHAAEIYKILKDNKMTIGIVTSALHMKRSMNVFNKYFNNAVPLPSSYIYSPKKLSIKSFLPNSQNFYNASIIFHEIFGLFWLSITN